MGDSMIPYAIGVVVCTALGWFMGYICGKYGNK